jgi:TonB family protein
MVPATPAVPDARSRVVDAGTSSPPSSVVETLPAAVPGSPPPAAAVLPAPAIDTPKTVAMKTPVPSAEIRAKSMVTLIESPPPDLSKVLCESRGCSGVIVVNVRVDASGRVAKATLAIKSSNQLLNARVLATVAEWRYLPMAEPGFDVVTLRLEGK